MWLLYRNKGVSLCECVGCNWKYINIILMVLYKNILFYSCVFVDKIFSGFGLGLV